MSEDRREANGAAEIHARAADWIFDRYDSEDWGRQDQAALDAWLNESLAHRVAYVRLETALTRSTRLAALRRVPAQIEQVKKEKPKVRAFPVRAFTIATAILMTGAGALYALSIPRTQTYATALGQHKTVRLADGTQIELNTDTELRARIGAHARTIWLDQGEAFFRVKHAPDSTFAVNAGGYRVKDLGTEFSVRSDAGRVEVALVEGRARMESVDAAAQMKPSDLKPGDVVVAMRGRISLARKPERELADGLAWRQGLLVFNYTTLGDAAAEFNRYNSKKIVIADSSTARLTVMGKFPVNDVDKFGQVLKTLFGVRVDTRGDAMVVSK
jgi:transmembrane sensor